MTAAQDAKSMANKAGRKVKRAFANESPLDRVQEVAQNADDSIRGFAKAQPVMALMVALSAGYLVGRAVARLA